jgi:hypothetical protein
MNAAKLPPLTKQQRAAALERAARERLEREALGIRDPLDEWPDGLPADVSEEEAARFEEAFRQHEEIVRHWRGLP